MIEERQLDSNEIRITRDNQPLRDMTELVEEQGLHSIGEQVTEVTFDNGVRMWGFPLQNADGENRLLLEITAPDGRRNAFLAQLIEDGVVLYNRQGSLVLEAVDEETFLWAVYDPAGNFLGGSAALPTYRPARTARPAGLGALDPRLSESNHTQQDVVTDWDEFIACMKGYAGAAMVVAACASALAWVKGSCTVALGTAGAFSAGCVAALFAALGACGIAVPYCLTVCVDDPPVCSMTDWSDTGRTRWSYYVDPEYYTTEGHQVYGYIHAKIWQAEIMCEDDRAGCCTYKPAKQIYVASGDPPNYALAYDKAGLEKVIDYFPPAPGYNELATLRKTNPETGEETKPEEPEQDREPEPPPEPQPPEPEQPQDWLYTARGKFHRIPQAGDSDGIPRGDPNQITIQYQESGGSVKVYAIFVAPPIGCMEMVSDDTTARAPIYYPDIRVMRGIIASRFKDCGEKDTTPGSADIEFEATVGEGKVTGHIGDAHFEADIVEAKSAD
jgi:hypothetical protein